MSEELEFTRIDKALIEAAAALHDLLGPLGLTVVTAESCTGGMLASLLTDVDGCGHAFERGFVPYTDAAKHALLDVPLTDAARNVVPIAATASLGKRSSRSHSSTASGVPRSSTSATRSPLGAASTARQTGSAHGRPFWRRMSSTTLR